MARELSISKKTIYQYFKDKKEIVYKVTEAHFAREKVEFDNIGRVSENSVHILYLLSKCIRKNVATLHPSLLFDLQKYHEDAWKLFISYKEKVFKNTIVEALNQGIKEGYVREEIDPNILATMRMEQVQMPFDERVFPRLEFDFYQVQMQLYDHFFHGILTIKGKKLLDNYIKNEN